MSPHELDFGALLGPGTWVALAPLMALAGGLVLLLLAEILDALRPLRGPFFLGAVIAAAALELRVPGDPDLAATGGLVLDGTLRADGATAAWGLVFLAGTALAWAFGRGYYRGSEARFQDEHDLLMLTCPLGMMLMAGAQDLLLFFVGLEVLSIPLYVLAAFRRGAATSVEAGLKYFLLGAFGSALFAYGASLLYAAAGTLSLPELALRFDPEQASPLALAGVALMVASLLFKLSVFPFHLWVPDVYQGSPTPVTALMAAGTKAAAVAFLLNASALLPAEAARLMALLGLVTMAAGYLGALVQEDLKRMLAYSGIASAGTLALVVAGALAAGEGAGEARTAALYYMGAYVFAITGAFGVLARLESDLGRPVRMAELAGLARSRPGLAAALSLFVLSLGGIPVTGGFLGKWLVFAVVVRADLIAVAVIGAVLSVVALGFYLRIVVAMWMQPEAEPRPAAGRAPAAALATAVCAAGVLLTGVLPGLFLP